MLYLLIAKKQVTHIFKNHFKVHQSVSHTMATSLASSVIRRPARCHRNYYQQTAALRVYFLPLSRERCDDNDSYDSHQNRRAAYGRILPRRPGLPVLPQLRKPVRYYKCCSSLHLAKSSQVQILPIFARNPSRSFLAPTGLVSSSLHSDSLVG